MTRKLVKQFFALGLLTACFCATLFSEYFLAADVNPWLQAAARDIFGFCSDPATQWVIVLCLTAYAGAFFYLEKGWNLCSPNLWLSALLALVLLSYTLGYDADNSNQVPVLLAGVVFGKAVLAWARGLNFDVESTRERRSLAIMSILLVLLAGIALWQPETQWKFLYHDTFRWASTWDNPNTYGLLMGVGVVLAVGLGCRKWKMRDGRPGKIYSIICLLAAMLTGYGCFKSYSRGAWVGTMAGLGYLMYLAFKVAKRRQMSRISATVACRRNRAALCVVLSSVLVLSFWQFRFSEWRPAQRVFSVTNINDFSWRNRVTAWNGELHMMRDRPLLGFGWGHVIEEYKQNYRAPRLAEHEIGSAVHLNDFFMIGTSAGVPALVCFAVYLWLTLRQKSKNKTALIPPPASNSPFLIPATCRAGVIVLLVGFWFDSALFDLAVAPIFWVLLELCKTANSSATAPVDSRNLERNAPEVVAPGQREALAIWPRRAAWALGALAFIQTFTLVSIPFLPANNLTLRIARMWLVAPAAQEDFAFLSANVDWRGRELNALLEQACLASYNRRLVNWQWDDSIYRQYVLTPTIEPQRDGHLDWRRPLWEKFYPLTKLETEPQVAAGIVLQRLHRQFRIADNAPLTIEEMWQNQACTPDGFEAVSVAALRSVGIPARLNGNKRAEFYNNGLWQTPTISP